MAVGLLWPLAGAAMAAALPARSIKSGGARVSVLTSQVLRLEIEAFEDEPSITFPHRYAVPVPAYSHTLSPSGLTLRTEYVELRLALPVSLSTTLSCNVLNVTITIAGSSRTVCPGTATGRSPVDPAYPGVVMTSWTDIILGPPGNLNGSVDTLDCYIGADGCYDVLQSRMQKGLVSREGYSVVDDSNTHLWLDLPGADSWQWHQARVSKGKDLYFFLHGHDYKAALQDFVNLAGRTPLKPWRTHGVWWSREYPFDEAQVHELVAGFASHQLPLNMLVLDYAWHYGPGDPGDVKGCNQPLLAGGGCRGGFGGYVWNKKLFPDPQRFQDWLHSKDTDLQLVLNIHDQCGIDSCQENYEPAAIAAGIDPSSKAPVQCNMLNQTYAVSLTRYLLENGEHESTDYWWEDYGLGGPGAGAHQIQCSPHDSDPNPPPSYGHCMHCYMDDIHDRPQLWTAYVHASRLERKNRRAFLLGINGGLGHHRYPGIGSGDVYEAWNTLHFEIQLTLSAANVVTEWNHDLGGFIRPSDALPGPNDAKIGETWLHNPERFARWLQAGVFQPIFRPHISQPGDPTPWHYPNFEVLQKAYQLRNALVPYIYSAAFNAFETGILPMHPLYYEYPEEEDAYTLSKLRGPEHPLQHFFGKDFVVSPITQPAGKGHGSIAWPLWVPPGIWLDWWSGQQHQGPVNFVRNYTAEEIPVLVRAGSIIPMKGLEDSKARAPERLILSVMCVVGVNGTARIYEDGGDDLDYQQGLHSITNVSLSGNITFTSLRIQGGGGREAVGLPSKRRFEVRFRGAPATATDWGFFPPMPAAAWWWENEEGGGKVLVGVSEYVASNTTLAASFFHVQELLVV